MSEPVSPTIRRTTTAAVAIVAAVAAAVSYEHMRTLGTLAGEGWRADVLPLSVDGLVVAASMALLVRTRAGKPAGPLVWASLTAGILASLAANVAAAQPTLIGRLVAGWPPLALVLAYELLMQQVRAGRTAHHVTEAPTPPATTEDTTRPTTAPADLNAVAQAHYRAALARGHHMTGHELGKQFKRSTTWGCRTIKAVKEQNQRTPTQSAVTGNQPPQMINPPDSLDKQHTTGNNRARPNSPRIV